MRFPAKITSSCIWVAIPVDWVILHWYACGADGRSGGRSVYGHVITKFSRMGRLPHILSYGAPPTRGASRVVGRSVGRCTVTWLPNFLGWVDYFIFLPLVLRWRASRTRAPLLCFIIGVLAVGVETSRCDKSIIVTKEITFGEEPVNGDCNRLNRNRKIGITQRGVHQLICRYSVNVFSTISTDFVYCIQLTGT